MWDGVRNHQAANNMRAMKAGDKAFFYHSVTGKEIVGILEVVREAYPDPTDEKGKFVAVDFRAVEPLARPVTLAQVKAAPELADMPLLKQSRLSVMPVSESAWEKVMEMAGV